MTLQTRITTKYTIAHAADSPKAPVKKSSRAQKTKVAGTEATPASTESTPPVRAILILKTYDPISGATLKYSTNKAAEVSRLIQIVGRLARPMAGLPEVKDEAMPDADAVEGTGTATPVVEQPQEKPKAGVSQGQSGKKGKKKGKK
ncbi:hypothetical protein BP6252_00771 [Coleophoma cylindrospora]|uniref:SRP9 domain-containing protein n=1 Tax=Coleophoma cylindrospora TaxID=1849047 RepID=A0A3D8SR10_9HELO|nr:hypothetical protein BP6252_00771 [Coleophoma cylindrospora]